MPRGKRIHRHYARMRDELDRHVLTGGGPLPKAGRAVRRRALREDYRRLGEEIDRLVEDPSTFPDFARLDSYWSGKTGEPPEKWYP